MENIERRKQKRNVVIVITVLATLALLGLLFGVKKSNDEQLAILEKENKKLQFDRDRLEYIRQIDSLRIVYRALKIEDKFLQEEVVRLQEEVENIANEVSLYDFDTNFWDGVSMLKFKYDSKIKVLKEKVAGISKDNLKLRKERDSAMVLSSKARIDSILNQKMKKIIQRPTPVVTKRKKRNNNDWVVTKTNKVFSKVKSIRKLENSEKIAYVKSAKRTTGLEICYTVEKDPKKKQGRYKLYMQVKDPKGNIVGDRYVLNKSSRKVHFTDVLSFQYNNTQYEDCKVVEPDKYREFEKGTYVVNILNTKGIIASSEIKLR